MTREELSQHDGQDGRRAYVAVSNTIYDVTDSPHWQNGLHPPDHRAGRDLTDEIKSAPHVRAVVERFPVVGKLEAEEPAGSGFAGGKVFAIIVLVAVVVIVGLMLIL